MAFVDGDGESATRQLGKRKEPEISLFFSQNAVWFLWAYQNLGPNIIRIQSKQASLIRPWFWSIGPNEAFLWGAGANGGLGGLLMGFFLVASCCWAGHVVVPAWAKNLLVCVVYRRRRGGNNQ